MSRATLASRVVDRAGRTSKRRSESEANTHRSGRLRFVGRAALLALALVACGGRGGGSPASANRITSFSFLSANNTIPVDSNATISGLSIQAFLPPGTDVKALKATFAASNMATVTVAGVPQASGDTANNFSGEVSYVVSAEDGTSRTYSVRVVTDIAAFDDAVHTFMTNYSVPGVSIAVTHGEKLIYLKAYGQADAQSMQPVTTQSLFRLASVSKPITAVAIMKLVEQGSLSLSDTVFGPSGVLGTTYGTQPYGPHLVEITVSELLHHTAGGWPNDSTDPMFTDPGLTADQLISRTLDTRPLDNVPGTVYAYSNFGFCILGRVIERVTGQSYEAAVKRLVLAPLGVTDMTIADNTLADRLPNEVVYYGQGGEDPYTFNIHRMDSHGGWVSTARDLATLLVHVDGFSSKPDILTSQSIATMSTPSTADANYACGWQVNSAHNWWHIGSLPGTTTEVIRAAMGWNWVVLVNTRSQRPSYTADLDQLFWTAYGSLTGYPDYDLF